jgi:hypothetical protein
MEMKVQCLNRLVQEQARGHDAEEVGDRSRIHRRVKPLVAFSSGPYAACLADGSEYTGDYADKLTFEQLVDFHRQKLRVGFLSSFFPGQKSDQICILEPTSEASRFGFPSTSYALLCHCRRLAYTAMQLASE